MTLTDRLLVPLPVFLLTCCGWVLLPAWVFAVVVAVVLVFALMGTTESTMEETRQAVLRVAYAVLWGAALSMSCSVAGMEHDAIQARINKAAGL